MLRRLTADGPGRTADTTALTADATLVALVAPPARLPTADAGWPTADATAPTVDADRDGLPVGWPCARLGTDPPSVADLQTDPSPESLLPQVLALAPRGPAWGTDEAGDGRGASRVMRQVWGAVAAWVAGVNRAESEVASQCFPSAITMSLPDWEGDYGLPDPCAVGGGGQGARVAAVRARFAAQGGASPAYFVCLAASIGYDVWIEEPTQFLVDVSEVVEDPLVELWFTIDEGECAEDGLTETFFVIDEGEIDATPVEGYALTGARPGTPLEDYLLRPDTVEADAVVEDSVAEAFFTIDDGEIDATPLDSTVPTYAGEMWRYWIVHVRALGETWFRIDEGEIAYDPIEGFGTAGDLECLLRRYSPAHTSLVFSYHLTPQ